MTIDELKQAVQDFYGDTSRSQEETRDALEKHAMRSRNLRAIWKR